MKKYKSVDARPSGNHHNKTNKFGKKKKQTTFLNFKYRIYPSSLGAES